MSIRSGISKIVTIGAITGVLGLGVITSEYQDIFGFSDKAEAGRTKNSISAVVAGVVGQQLYDGNSSINLKIEKQFWPDASLVGSTTPQGIDTYVDLALTSARFKADGNASAGSVYGTVDKSEFDWDVKQTGKNSYLVERLGWKFNSELKLTKVADGKIEGTYVRRGFHFSWDVNGTYDKDGNVKINIDGPLCLGVDLVGKITKK